MHASATERGPHPSHLSSDTSGPHAYVEHEVPSGVSAIAIPGIILPAGLPFGVYTIEAALLEPDFGVTLSRHTVSLSWL
jgi:hypothetical protein